MKPMNLERVVRNIDRRLERVEQILPTLPTREELREEFERSRRHTQILFESLKDEIRLVAEGLAPTQAEVTQVIRPTLAVYDKRITALEDARGRTGGGRKSPI